MTKCFLLYDSLDPDYNTNRKVTLDENEAKEWEKTDWYYYQELPIYIPPQVQE